MDTNPVFRRRQNHNNTPESVILIITNVIVFIVATEVFANCTKISNVYWFVLGALGVYNFFNIRKYREDYGKAQYIAYVVSIIVLIAMFFLLRSRAQNC
ncbi:hypothetical protein [Mucilaginibacter sp.]|jgi:hypothetical protein|uniref:hypothetical protein n=1 Tax=Mucilaginibacter sp. TaxID=1882438 RepID=UPI000EB59D39